VGGGGSFLLFQLGIRAFSEIGFSDHEGSVLALLQSYLIWARK
jgi:hypothetical protein